MPGDELTKTEHPSNILTDQALSDGGMVLAKAWFRKEDIPEEERKRADAAARKRKSRKSQEDDQNVTQCNVILPNDEHARKLITKLADTLRENGELSSKLVGISELNIAQMEVIARCQTTLLKGGFKSWLIQKIL